MNIKSGCDMRKLPDTKFNQTSGEVSWKIARQLIIGADTKAGSIRDYKSEGEIWLWQIQLL